MLTGDPLLKTWYEELLVKRLEHVYISMLRGIGYHRLDKASGSEVDMTLVAGTVGNIDPNALCDDEGCAQQGEAYKDHRVAHTTRGVRKGQRGECPHCHGKLHNVHDSAQLIAFQCLWKQVFGDVAKKVPVNAANLGTVVYQIKAGTVTGWADRALLYTATIGPSAPVALPKAPAPAASTGSASTAAPTTPAVSQAARSLAQPAPEASLGSGTPPPAVTPSAVPSAADKAERKRKLQDALKDAKVMP